MFTNVYNDFIFNNPKLETTQMSLNRGTSKQTAIHSYNGILQQQDGTHGLYNVVDAL